eukprot:766684-Hanusia_phi.AAC.7
MTEQRHVQDPVIMSSFDEACGIFSHTARDDEDFVRGKEAKACFAKSHYDLHIRLTRACILQPQRQPVESKGRGKASNSSQGIESGTDARDGCSPSVTPHKRKREATSAEKGEELCTNRNTTTTDEVDRSRSLSHGYS